MANHEKGVWCLDEFLELVFACFGRGSGIQEILSENLVGPWTAASSWEEGDAYHDGRRWWWWSEKEYDGCRRQLFGGGLAAQMTQEL